MLSRVFVALANSGVTLNQVGFVRLVQRFPRASRILRLRVSPEILAKLNSLPANPINARLYAGAVGVMRVGPAVKMVGVDRNALTDDCILRIIRREHLQRICDIGVSDGSASVRLFRESPGISIRLFDRFTWFEIRRRGLGVDICNALGERVYRRVGIFLCYVHGAKETPNTAIEGIRVEIGNPLLRAFSARIESLDVFEGDPGGRFQLIKCCNLLNVNIFSPADLLKGIHNLLKYLEEDGYLVVGQNHADYREGEAFFVLQRRAEGIVLIEERNDHWLLPLIRPELKEMTASSTQQRV